MKFFTSIVLGCMAAFFIVGCASDTDDGPQPQGEKLSALPHNRPSSWEGQAGMGAAFNQYQQ